MATIFSHAVVALTMGHAVSARRRPLRFWIAAVVCSIVPDFDVLGFGFGIRYGDLLGHRGLTHSLLFAVVVGILTARALFPEDLRARGWWKLPLFLAMVSASHGVLDAMTDGGLGVAFFSPFDPSRYFLPWRPIRVSPIGAGFFSRTGGQVLFIEFLWIFLPSFAVTGLITAIRAASVRFAESPDSGAGPDVGVS